MAVLVTCSTWPSAVRMSRICLELPPPVARSASAPAVHAISSSIGRGLPPGVSVRAPVPSGFMN